MGTWGKKPLFLPCQTQVLVPKHRDSSCSSHLSCSRKHQHLPRATSLSLSHRKLSKSQSQPGPADPSITKAASVPAPLTKPSLFLTFPPVLCISPGSPLGFSVGDGPGMNGSLFRPCCGTSGRVSVSTTLHNSGFY